MTVASSGGGIRSAYWTAAVLDCIIDGETVGDDPCAGRTNAADAERRRDSLTMLSGVSGGAVGMVSYIAQIDGGWQVATGAAPPRWYDQRFGADFQAAVFSEMLTGDAIEFFLRAGRGDDRARTLERAFESQWPDGEPSRGSLIAQNSGEPFLFLHGFSAENGCRFNLSILDSDGLQPAGSCSAQPTGPPPALHGTTDLADFLCGDDDLRRSTAALLSARFPYVTPSGHLETQDCHRASAETKIVDGGYRSSSGSSAIAELWPALGTEIQLALDATSPGSCLAPIHLQIDSSKTSVADTTDAPNETARPGSSVLACSTSCCAISHHSATPSWPTSRDEQVRPWVWSTKDDPRKHRSPLRIPTVTRWATERQRSGNSRKRQLTTARTTATRT